MTPRTAAIALTLAFAPVSASAQLDLSFLDRIPAWALNNLDKTWMQPLPAQPWPVDIPADVRLSKRLSEAERRVLPPIEFERPYLGNLSLVRVTTNKS